MTGLEDGETRGDRPLSVVAKLCKDMLERPMCRTKKRGSVSAVKG